MCNSNVSLTVFGCDSKAELSIFHVGTVIPNSRIEQHHISGVHEEAKPTADVVALWRWRDRPSFTADYLTLPHQSWNVIQLQ